MILTPRVGPHRPRTTRQANQREAYGRCVEYWRYMPSEVRDTWGEDPDVTAGRLAPVHVYMRRNIPHGLTPDQFRPARVSDPTRTLVVTGVWSHTRKITILFDSAGWETGDDVYTLLAPLGTGHLWYHPGYYHDPLERGYQEYFGVTSGTYEVWVYIVTPGYVLWGAPGFTLATAL